jgi:hypothetical protein
MRTLSLRPDDLHVQSFPTSAGAVELRGTLQAALNSVGKTCGNPPASDDTTCEYARGGPTRPIQCCI